MDKQEVRGRRLIAITQWAFEQQDIVDKIHNGDSLAMDTALFQIRDHIIMQYGLNRQTARDMALTVQGRIARGDKD